jgi:hypothetical protein
VEVMGSTVFTVRYRILTTERAYHWKKHFILSDRHEWLPSAQGKTAVSPPLQQASAGF